MADEGDPTNVMEEAESYGAFYEQLGKFYPETEFVHAFRRIGSRYWTVLQELRPYASGKEHMIDIGCNDGVYTFPYCEAGGEATGIDISRSLVDECNVKARYLKLPCSFVQADIDSPDFQTKVTGEFDVALFSEVLEHLRNPAGALSAIRSLVKDGGRMILTTPTPLFNGVNSKWKYLLSLFAGNKLLHPNMVDTRDIPVLVRYGIPPSQYRHDGYYPRALNRYVEGFGFTLMRSYTIEYPEKVRRALFWTGVFGSHPELTMRKVPLLNLLGVTNVTLFRAG